MANCCLCEEEIDDVYECPAEDLCFNCWTETYGERNLDKDIDLTDGNRYNHELALNSIAVEPFNAIPIPTPPEDDEEPSW